MKTYYANKAQTTALTDVYLNADGTAKNITGHTTYLKIAKFFDSTTSLTIPGVITSAVNGTVQYNVNPTILTNAAYGTYNYSRYLVDETLAVVSVINGTFVILPAIS